MPVHREKTAEFSAQMFSNMWLPTRPEKLASLINALRNHVQTLSSLVIANLDTCSAEQRGRHLSGD
jgi:hypothetical protein